MNAELQQPEREVGVDIPRPPEDDDISDESVEAYASAEPCSTAEPCSAADVLSCAERMRFNAEERGRSVIAKENFETRHSQPNFSSHSRVMEITNPFVPTFAPPMGAFLSPLTSTQATQPPQPSLSNSSHSSESSISSQQTWSFEEQFKQVRQLYSLGDEPDRKAFLDELFSFMQQNKSRLRATPINRLPIMAKATLDLYKLYKLVVARGGLVEVINKKLWQEIIKGLNLPSSITSAAFTLRTQYMKYLFPYECHKLNLSTDADLQTAIDGNKRESRNRPSFDSSSRYGFEPPNPNHLQYTPLMMAQHHQQLAARMTLGVGAINGNHVQNLAQSINGVGHIGPSRLPNPAEMDDKLMQIYRYINNKVEEHRVPTIHAPEAPMPSEAALLEFHKTFMHNLNNNIEPQKEPINLSEPMGLKRENDIEENGPGVKRLRAEEEEEEVERKTPSPTTSRPRSSFNFSYTEKGDNSLLVELEVNGKAFQGVLFAKDPVSGSSFRTHNSA